MSDSLKLRPAASDDEDWMFAPYRRVLGEHISHIWGWNEAWQVADFRKGLTQAHCRVIELDGSCVGFVRFAGDTYLGLQLLALAPEYQGRDFWTAVIRVSRTRVLALTSKSS